jgi:hypothetical protein
VVKWKVSVGLDRDDIKLVGIVQRFLKLPRTEPRGDQLDSENVNLRFKFRDRPEIYEYPGPFFFFFLSCYHVCNLDVHLLGLSCGALHLKPTGL